jgi:hypothetical protein
MNPPVNEFQKPTDDQAGSSILSEFWQFLCWNKKWWLMPIVIILLLLGALVLLSGNSGAPFIYTLF